MSQKIECVCESASAVLHAAAVTQKKEKGGLYFREKRHSWPTFTGPEMVQIQTCSSHKEKSTADDR